MHIIFYSKRIAKLLGFSLIIPFIFFDINVINRQIKAEKNLLSASEKDLFLYRQMGASYLCIASKAEVNYKDDIETTAITSKAKGTKCPVCWKINEDPCPRHG